MCAWMNIYPHLSKDVLVTARPSDRRDRKVATHEILFCCGNSPVAGDTLLEMHWLQTVHSNLSSYTSPHNVDIKFIDIPTTPSPIQPTQQQLSPTATVFRLNDNTAIVHARLTDANSVLELRYLNWTEKPDVGKPFSSPRNLRLQIRLSATLLPVIRFSQDSESLWCYVLTTNNYLVRMRLTLESMFLTPLSGKFYSLQQLDKHIVPVTFGTVSSTQVIIACENGSLIYLYDSSNGKRDKGDYCCARLNIAISMKVSN
jgi:Nucleoporin Nup120/160